jgi:hypothetical protein
MGRSPFIVTAILASAFGLLAGCGDDDADPAAGDTSVTEDASNGLGDADAAADAEAGDLEFDTRDADGEPDAPEPARVHARFDPAGGFFDAPFPIETRRRTDGTIDFSDFPNPGHNPVLGDYLAAADAARSGFSRHGAIFFPLDGAIDPATLPATLDDSLEPEASVFLLDIDPSSMDRGQRIPIRVGFYEPAGVLRPANFLALLPYPGEVLGADGLYAAVVRSSVHDEQGRPLAAPEGIVDLLEGRLPVGLAELTGAEALRQGFAALATTLEAEGGATDDIAAATVFRTGDPVAEMVALRDAAAAFELPDVEIVGQIRDHDGFCVLEGRTSLPIYQVGDRPYNESGTGHIELVDGVPQLQWVEEVRFAVTIPDVSPPSAGFPLLFFAAGQGGRYTQVVDRGTFGEQGASRENGLGPAHYLAIAGIATLGIEAPLVGPRHPDGSFAGLDFFNFQNLVALRDNVRQAAAEYTVLARVAAELEVDLTGLCPDAAATGQTVRFDSDRFFLWGHSTGASISELVLAVEPAFSAGILSGAGGSWIYNLTLKEQPLPVRTAVTTLLRLLPDELDELHPVATLFQTTADAAEPMSYAPHWFDHPLPGGAPRHVLLIEGVVDGYFLPRMVAALAMAGRFDLAEPVVEPGLLEDIGRVGGGLLSLPAGPNRGDVSGVAVQFAAEGFDGHYVPFELSEPKYVYRCWLESLLESGRPTIVEAESDARAPCPRLP